MYQANVYKVMIGAPSDIKDEIQVACKVINKWNYINSESRHCVLMPLHWSFSSYPSSSSHPQKLLNKQLVARSDFMLAFFGSKVGTATDTDISGTVEEINEHLRAGKKVMVFFRNRIEASKLDVEQFKKLQDYKRTIQDKVIWVDYEDEHDLESLLYDKVCLFANDNINGYETQGPAEVENIELEAAKAELARIKAAQQKYLQDIASLDEKVCLHGTKSHLWQGQMISQDWQVEVTWKQLFESIAPYLMEYPNDKKVERLLTSIAFSYTKERADTFLEMSNQDFQTIKVQFIGLKLVYVSYSETTKKDMALFWHLTKGGEQLMMQLRTIKTAKPHIQINN